MSLSFLAFKAYIYYRRETIFREYNLLTDPRDVFVTIYALYMTQKALKVLEEMYLPPRPDLLPLELVGGPALHPSPQVHDVELHIPQSPGLGEPNIRLTRLPGSSAGNVSDSDYKAYFFPVRLNTCKIYPPVTSESRGRSWTHPYRIIWETAATPEIMSLQTNPDRQDNIIRENSEESGDFIFT